MAKVTKITLQEIISRLPELPKVNEEGEEIDHMIFAASPSGTWQPDTLAVAVVCPLDAPEAPPTPEGMTYFLEASIAEEVIDVYKNHAFTRDASPDERTAAVIYYATNDSYLPVESR